MRGIARKLKREKIIFPIFRDESKRKKKKKRKGKKKSERKKSITRTGWSEWHCLCVALRLLVPLLSARVYYLSILLHSLYKYDKTWEQFDVGVALLLLLLLLTWLNIFFFSPRLHTILFYWRCTNTSYPLTRCRFQLALHTISDKRPFFSLLLIIRRPSQSLEIFISIQVLNSYSCLSVTKRVWSVAFRGIIWKYFFHGVRCCVYCCARLSQTQSNYFCFFVQLNFSLMKLRTL